MIDKSCATCRYWNSNQADAGFCQRIPAIPTQPYSPATGVVAAIAPRAPHMPRPDVALYTGHDFCCSEYQEAQAEPGARSVYTVESDGTLLRIFSEKWYADEFAREHRDRNPDFPIFVSEYLLDD